MIHPQSPSGTKGPSEHHQVCMLPTIQSFKCYSLKQKTISEPRAWQDREASDALGRLVPNCGTQFCFHRNQFGGIFIFNYSTTSNFPSTPQPDWRREIAYVNHPGNLLASLRSPCSPLHWGGMIECGNVPWQMDIPHGFWPRLWDTICHLSPCQDRKQIISMPMGTAHSGRPREAGSPHPHKHHRGFLQGPHIP